MLYTYKAVDKKGVPQEGTIDVVSSDVAINSLQNRGLIVFSVKEIGEEKKVFNIFPFFSSVSQRDIVAFSEQVATLFGSQVSALKVFRLIADETGNVVLKKALYDISDRIQGGSSIANAFARYPLIFSDFYVNMIRAGEESGKIADTFAYLADYLDRTYEITTKSRNALIYPAFVISTFVIVMILMFTVIIPKIGGVVLSSGQEIPLYTKIVFGLSDFFINFGYIIGLLFLASLVFLFYYTQTEQGKIGMDKFKLSIPIVGNMYHKLYLSRIADNMSTLIQSGIPIVRSLEITATVVDNEVYRSALEEVVVTVKGGKPMSIAISEQEVFPGIMIAMMKVGEETGELRAILHKLAAFYKRELVGAIDTLISLIEPAMIVFLGISVGFLLASVLIPIYNVSTSAGF